MDNLKGLRRRGACARARRGDQGPLRAGSHGWDVVGELTLSQHIERLIDGRRGSCS
jgi:hypothetical protein